MTDRLKEAQQRVAQIHHAREVERKRRIADVDASFAPILQVAEWSLRKAQGE
jgi:hypothetical protein